MSGVRSRGAARVDQVRRDRHVAAAIASIEGKFGHGAIHRLGTRATSDVQVIPIGLAELDRIVGVGGLPRGRIVEVLGHESAGVSTLLLHAVAAAQSRGGIAALIDVDRGFDPEYARRIGIDLSSLFIAQPDDGAMALEIVDALVRSTAFDLVAVDSVAALEPPDQTDTDAISSRGARQGRLLSEALRRLAAGVDPPFCCSAIARSRPPMTIWQSRRQADVRCLSTRRSVLGSRGGNSYARSSVSSALRWRRAHLRTR